MQHSNLIRKVAKSEAVRNYGLRVRAVGDREAFFAVYDGNESELEDILDGTQQNDGKLITVNFAYNPEKDFLEAMQRCHEEGVEFTFENIARYATMNPTTFSIRTGYPQGFNKISCWSPGIERARLFSMPKPIQEISQNDFRRIVDSYFSLEDSIETQYGRRE